VTIRSHRLRLGLTQEELARRAGLSVRALRDIEQGRVIRPRSSSFDRLLNVLELSDEDRSHLLGQDEADFSELTVGVLGPLTVSAGGVAVDLVSGPQQTLLGMLALHAGAVVSVDELALVFWPNRAPRAWRNLIHVYVNRLRAALEPAREKRARPGDRLGERRVPA
jgi:transcriptional regulator with XRE-family HTH domain